MLTQEDRLRVEAAIREAERGTAGEIVLVIARQAASYRSVPLLYALAAALLTPPPLLLWGGLPPVRLFLVQLAAAALALAAASRQRSATASCRGPSGTPAPGRPRSGSSPRVDSRKRAGARACSSSWRSPNGMPR
jgi:putative membrane protein